MDWSTTAPPRDPKFPPINDTQGDVSVEVTSGAQAPPVKASAGALTHAAPCLSPGSTLHHNRTTPRSAGANQHSSLHVQSTGSLLKAAPLPAPRLPTPPHQDHSEERRRYEDRRKALFFTDREARRLYRDHVRAVSKAAGGVGVRRRHVMHRFGRLRTVPACCAACRSPARSPARALPQSWAALVVPRTPCAHPTAPAQVLERRNTLTGRLYRDDPTILAFDLLNELRCSSYEASRERRAAWAGGGGLSIASWQRVHAELLLRVRVGARDIA